MRYSFMQRPVDPPFGLVEISLDRTKYGAKNQNKIIHIVSFALKMVVTSLFVVHF